MFFLYASTPSEPEIQLRQDMASESTAPSYQAKEMPCPTPSISNTHQTSNIVSRNRLKKNQMSISMPDYETVLSGEDAAISSLRTYRYLKLEYSDATSLPPPMKFSQFRGSPGFSRSRSAECCDAYPVAFSSTLAIEPEFNLFSDAVAECSKKNMIEFPDKLPQSDSGDDKPDRPPVQHQRLPKSTLHSSSALMREVGHS